MTTDNALLERVRKLLAKAESEGTTPEEAESVTAKAAELMARYGIDRALLAAQQPETDLPADRKIDVDHPWARVQGHLLCGLASALRCQCVILPRRGPGTRVHIFGFASDIERTEVLYTSLLVQMWRGLAAVEVPGWTRSPRAWRRSWLLGFTSAVVARVRAAEQRAAEQAERENTGTGPGTELVLADRRQIDPARHRSRLSPDAKDQNDVHRQRLWRWICERPAGRPGQWPSDRETAPAAWRQRPVTPVPGPRETHGRHGAGESRGPGPAPGTAVAAGPVACSGEFSLAGAAGSATGLSLRSPRTVKIFSGTRAAMEPAKAGTFLSLPAEKHLAGPGPAGCPPALLRLRASPRRNTPSPRSRHLDSSAGRHAMDDEYIPVETFTCAYPGCGVTASVAESIYVEEYGQICRRCDEAHFGPRPEYWEIELPY